MSLYRGYDLRTVRPEAVSLVYDLPRWGEYPTRHREAADAPGGGSAAALGARCAVRGATAAAFVRSRRTAPLFAATGHRAVTPARTAERCSQGLPLPRSQRQE